MIETDIVIIGAGPCGLFTVFEAGLLKLRCHLIDHLPQVGGQLSEIYPKKPIYDIPGFPEVLAQDLVDNLMKQIEPFKPTFTLGERAESVSRLDDKSFEITTSSGDIVRAKIIAIAGGLGCFEPRKPPLASIANFEGKGVHYMVKNPEEFEGKDLVLAGGGDSALDWAIELCEKAKSLTLVHRRSSFRGSIDSADKVKDLAEKGKIDLLTKSQVIDVHGDEHLEAVEIRTSEGDVIQYPCDAFIPLFGLSPKLGPISDWGLNLDKNQIEVDTYDYSTNAEGIYAIGDINTYKGKLKLILCGFHEATLMVQSAFRKIYPDQKLSFKYTTVTGITGL